MKWKNNFSVQSDWTDVIVNREAKVAIAQKLAERAKEGETIGAGSGSTVYLTLEALAERIRKENLHITVIPASFESTMACLRFGIPLTTLWEKRPDWTFDGADEVDPEHNLLKGRGGALFQEKLLIRSSKEVYIVVDESKFVSRLGTNFPVPVELFPGALAYVENCIWELGATEVTLRPAKGKDGPVITENGNLILDVRFEQLSADLERKIKAVTGVIESGLFMGYCLKIISLNR